MATATLSSREAPPNQTAKTNTTTRRTATDDEILGIVERRTPSALLDDQQTESIGDVGDVGHDGHEEVPAKDAESPADSASDLRALLDSNPQLRSAWDDAAEYRKAFATPEEARAAGTKLADLDRLDALFFSGRPEDHAELARAVAALDPASFKSLTEAMAHLASSRLHVEPKRRPTSSAETSQDIPTGGSSEESTGGSANLGSKRFDQTSPGHAALTPAQTQFFHSTNAAAVDEVLHAIESQVQKILPEEISKSARNRVVGEIYRELDNTLQSNRQLSQQMRDAFRSGALDSEHQRAIVSLVAARARQALPAVAKRVLNEWTSTIVAANQDRRARQRSAERRVDIAGSGRTGSEGRRPTSPRDIDYARMSDSDILNL